jgi:SynChlorMet cassette protein ScmC
MTPKSYKLELSDGTKYGFAAADELVKYLNMLVKMLTLEEAEKDEEFNKRFIFIARKNAAAIPDVFRKLRPVKPNLYFEILYRDPLPDVYFDINTDLIEHQGMHISAFSSALKIVNKHYVDKGGATMHTAFAGLCGNGVLITATANTGKTTSIERLPEYWEKLSDDLALLISMPGGKYNVHPLPTWSNYIMQKRESPVNMKHHLPLKAVFFLEQSKTDEVLPLTAGEAAMRIFRSLQRESERLLPKMTEIEKKKTDTRLFDTATNLARSIHCYKLKATLHGQFWKEIEKIVSY